MSHQDKSTAINTTPVSHPVAAPPARAPKRSPADSRKKTWGERLRHALKHVFPTLLLAVGLIIVQKIVIERTSFGQQLKLMGARMLDTRLSDFNDWHGEPVRIIDISSLPPSSPAEASEPSAVTDRLKLTEYLDQLAKVGPAAIGIDVIFDPSPDGIVSDNDKRFLDHCLHLHNKAGTPIPVRVGVYSTLALGPENWLGDPRFGALGTSIVVPSPDPDSRATRMFRQLTIKVGARTVVADSLSYSLFKIARNEATEVSSGARSVDVPNRTIGAWLNKVLPWLFEEPHSLTRGAVEADSFSIDFGLVEELMRTKVGADEIQNRGYELENKVVIIGRATPGQAFDSFLPAASSSSNQPIPGVYLHAAAVQTLMDDTPSFELNEWGSILTDLAFLVCLVASASGIDFLKERESASNHELSASLEGALPAFVATAVFVLGLALVEITRIYWTDFLIVAFVQLIHTPVESIANLLRLTAQKFFPFLQHKVVKKTALLFVVIGLSATGIVAQEPALSARIQSLSGAVFLRRAGTPTDKTPIRLHPRRDVLSPLYEGDQLQALQDGTVQIVLRPSLKIITLHARDTPFRLPHVPTQDEISAGADVLKIGIPAASRDVAPLLWSPAADSAIRAQNFRLRWNPPRTAEPFSVTISRADGSKLWSVDAIDSARSGLNPRQEAEVAGLLLRERSQSAPQRYSVTISSDRQGSPKTTFSVISSADETRLQAQLARWDQSAEDPLVRAIARAEVCRNANLIYEVADEYDRALVLAPESVTLLQADLAMHRQIGDLARSKELAVRLGNVPTD